MKKIIAALLAAITIISVFSACSKKEQTVETKEETATVKSDDVLISEFKENIETKADGKTTETDPMTVQEKSDGISAVALSSKVKAGEMGTLTIMGSPKKEFSFSVTDIDSNKLEFAGTGNKTSDKAGFASWGFTVPENCGKGLKVIIVREEGTDKYLQTSITVY